MTRRTKLIPVYRLEDIPASFASDEELAAFWETHEFTEAYDADARAHGWDPARAEALFPPADLSRVPPDERADWRVKHPHRRVKGEDE